MSCRLGDCLTSRPEGYSQPRELQFLIYPYVYKYVYMYMDVCKYACACLCCTLMHICTCAYVYMRMCILCSGIVFDDLDPDDGHLEYTLRLRHEVGNEDTWETRFAAPAFQPLGPRVDNK